MNRPITAEQLPQVDDAPVSAATAFKRWLPHTLALLFPVNALVYLLTGPHGFWVSLAFAGVVHGSVVLDVKSKNETRQPLAKMPQWPFDLLLAALIAIQIANVVLLANLFRTESLLSWTPIFAIMIVGSSSGYSGIVVAHELIHRPNSVWRTFGRIILSTVLYEHFYTEHVRGHHVRVGTPEDPATARFGENFKDFYLRTVPAQFKSAWRLETKRLGDVNMKWHDPRILKSRVFHGLVFEWGAAFAMLAFWGPASFVIHVLQAWWATRALEIVNYFEHWGLVRDTARVMPQNSWDTSSRFTYYGLTGLSRHADHHAFASRPYQQLRLWDESPKLPRGYLGMFPMVIFNNRKFRHQMTKELKARRLGPFAEGGKLAHEVAEGASDAPAELQPQSSAA